MCDWQRKKTNQLVLKLYKFSGNKCPLKDKPHAQSSYCKDCRGSLEEMESCWDVTLIKEKDRKVKVVFT